MRTSPALLLGAAQLVVATGGTLTEVVTQETTVTISSCGNYSGHNCPAGHSTVAIPDTTTSATSVPVVPVVGSSTSIPATTSAPAETSSQVAPSSTTTIHIGYGSSSISTTITADVESTTSVVVPPYGGGNTTLPTSILTAPASTHLTTLTTSSVGSSSSPSASATKTGSSGCDRVVVSGFAMAAFALGAYLLA